MVPSGLVQSESVEAEVDNHFRTALKIVTPTEPETNCWFYVEWERRIPETLIFAFSLYTWPYFALSTKRLGSVAELVIVGTMSV